MDSNELLLKTASFLRDISGRVQELEKAAQADNDLLLATERLEILEKTGQIMSTGDSILERAKFLMERADYQKLAVLADTGSEDFNIGRPDSDASTPKYKDAMDRGVYEGYDNE